MLFICAVIDEQLATDPQIEAKVSGAEAIDVTTISYRVVNWPRASAC